MEQRNTGNFIPGYDRDQYIRDYRASHPDKVKRWRLNAAVSLCRRNGYVVTKEPAAEDRDQDEVQR